MYWRICTHRNIPASTFCLTPFTCPERLHNCPHRSPYCWSMSILPLQSQSYISYQKSHQSSQFVCVACQLYMSDVWCPSSDLFLLFLLKNHRDILCPIMNPICFYILCLFFFLHLVSIFLIVFSCVFLLISLSLYPHALSYLHTFAFLHLRPYIILVFVFDLICVLIFVPSECLSCDLLSLSLSLRLLSS